MLDLVTGTGRRGAGISRRTMLSVGSICLGGLSLPQLFELQAQAGTSAKRQRSVIVVWAHGGPSHLETYDLKPDAPSGTRSLFRPIATNVPGIDICELLPKHAKIADKFTILRSLAHDQADHGFGTRRLCTGFGDDMPGSNNGSSYYPSMETAIYRSLGVIKDGLPVSVNLGPFKASTPWRGPGFFGSKFDVPQYQVNPFNRQTGGVEGMRLRVDPNRFADRRHLLAGLDHFRAGLDVEGTLDAADEYQHQAFAVLGSSRVASAFDISQESERTRQRYDACGFAQDLLLARRLVEAGVNFVNVYVSGQAYGTQAKSFNWDDHAVNWDLPGAMRTRLPWFDHAVSTLIEDVYERGLDEHVLIVVTGEFGRSPRLEFNANGNIGRDHWPNAMSMLISGGGKRRGNVIGATNSKGEHPVTHAYDPHDFLATIYRYLGIDPQKNYLDMAGRPHPLSRGTPIAELV